MDLVENRIDSNRLDALLYRRAVKRAGLLSYFLGVGFGVYGFTSIGFIQHFSPEASVWSNTWPRLLFCSVPLFLLGLFSRYSNLSERVRLLLWTIGFSIVFHVTSWIYVWPLVLKGYPEILLYVGPANTYLFAALYAVVAPPVAVLGRFTLIVTSIFVIPLFIVTYLGHSAVVLQSVLNDMLLALSASTFLGWFVDKLHTDIAKFQLGKETEASKFLGPVVSKAIFSNEAERLKSVRCRGFILSLDLRNSTELQKTYSTQWLEFRKAYFALVGELVSRHNGYIQKTVGDAHVINFGIMDYGVDLSDIPGIEIELEAADNARLKRASHSAFAFIYDLFHRAHELSAQYFAGKSVLIGAGLDKGWVERGIQGSEAHSELDVNGDPVNCSSRLQEYSKLLLKEFPSSSILAASPFASDYIDVTEFKTISTVENPIRNYQSIKWVLVYSYSNAEEVELAPVIELRSKIQKTAA